MNILFTQFCEEYGLDVQAISGYLARGTRVGKILRKLGMHPQKVQQGVLLFQAEQLAANVHLSTEMYVIKEAYASIESCMTDHAERVAAFYSHPMLVGQGLRLATYQLDGKIVGRALVNDHTHGRSEIYSKQSSLEFEIGLRHLGYEYGPNVLSGMELPPAEFVPYLDEFGGNFHQWRIVGEGWWKAVPEIDNEKELCEELHNKFGTVQNMETLIEGQWVQFTELSQLYKLEYNHSCDFSGGVYYRRCQLYPEDERYATVNEIVNTGYGLRGEFHARMVEMLWKVAEEAPWLVHYWVMDDYGRLRPTFGLETPNEGGFATHVVKPFTTGGM